MDIDKMVCSIRAGVAPAQALGISKAQVLDSLRSDRAAYALKANGFPAMSAERYTYLDWTCAHDRVIEELSA